MLRLIKQTHGFIMGLGGTYGLNWTLYPFFPYLMLLVLVTPDRELFEDVHKQPSFEEFLNGLPDPDVHDTD